MTLKLAYDLKILFESLLRYASQAGYRQHKAHYHAAFEQAMAEDKQAGKACMGVSSEWPSFNFSPEMADPELKVQRLAETQDPDAHILFIVRNQASLLKSVYAELVKVGYAGTYFDYCAYLWNFRDRSMLQDYCYDIQYERLTRYFHKDNIHILPLESYRQADGSLMQADTGNSLLIEALCDCLDIGSPQDFALPQTNPSLTGAEVAAKRELNAKHRHDFGNLLLEPSNMHSSRKQLTRNEPVGIDDYFRDIKTKRRLLEHAKAVPSVDSDDSIYKLPLELLDKLVNLIATSNAQFEQMTGVRLPKSYQGVHSQLTG